MSKLTDEQIAKVEQHYRRTIQNYIDEPFTKEIRALCDEVHEGRRVVEIDGATTQYAATLAACSRCQHPLYVVDRQKFCDECGMKIFWKE